MSTRALHPRQSSAMRRDRAPRSLSKRVKYFVVHLLLRTLLGVMLHLPRRAQAALGAALAGISWLLWGAGRRRVERNWRAALGRPPKSSDVRRCFRRMGALLVDTVRLLNPDEPANETLSLDARSESVFRDALDPGRGVVFISAHLGSFERLAAVIAARGLPAAVVARESSDPRITSLYERVRRPRGVEAIYRGGHHAGVHVAKALSRGGAVGMLIDLPARVPGIEMELMGRSCRVPVGPARLALAKGSAVLVGTPVPADDRDPAAGARIRIERVDTEGLATGEAGERELTRRIVRVIEQRVRLQPEAWLGMFRAVLPSEA